VSESVSPRLFLEALKKLSKDIPNLITVMIQLVGTRSPKCGLSTPIARRHLGRFDERGLRILNSAVWIAGCAAPCIGASLSSAFYTKRSCLDLYVQK
jgi:hypothetical protein